MSAADLSTLDSSLDPVVKEAMERYARCSKWEANTRKLWLEDYKFAEADSDNGYQWPNDIRRNRDVDEKPCLTINQVRQFNLNIINDAKQNKPGIKVLGIGNGATFEAAQMWSAVIRKIEYQSNAPRLYNQAMSFAVKAGFGAWRITTDYSGPDSFDQDIFIRGIKDPLTVFIDPDAQEPDKSDARFGFIFDDLPKELAKKQFPDYEDKFADAAIGSEVGWVTEDTVRICEYFRAVEKKDKLLALTNPAGDSRIMRQSRIPKEMVKDIIDNPQTRWRDIVETEIEWYLIIGSEIVEKKKWPGKYIPIVLVPGEEVIIDGVLDRKSHTRALKDPQRMYNYAASGSVEYGALQSKSPYIGAVEAIEGYESYWNTANKVNHSLLPYNGVDEAGNKIERPQRQEPPVGAPLFLEAMNVCQEQLHMVSGQWQAQIGQPGNERSAKAINERERQGDRATYHYTDQQALGIGYTGKILVDLIPHIYDTARVMRAMGEDGTDFELEINPQQKQAYVQHMAHDGKTAQRMLNPAVGKFEVVVDVGPAYATRREEAFNAFTTILTQAPQMAGIIGDILFKAGDFPMAEEAAARLRRMVPAHALGEGPSLQEQALTQQVTQLKGLLGKVMEELSISKIQLKGKDQLRDVDVYKAETDRIGTIGKILPMNPADMEALVRQLVEESLNTSLAPVLAASAPGLASAAGAGNAEGAAQAAQVTRQQPTPGARLGPNGEWYTPNPTMSSRYTPV